MKSQPSPIKKHNFNNQVTFHKAQQNNLSQISTSSRLTQTNFNPNKEISSNLDVQFPPPKRHRSSVEETQQKVQQNHMLPSIRSLQSTQTNLGIQFSNHKRSVEVSSKTIVEDEPLKFSINFTKELESFFQGSKSFTVIGSEYIESQRVITYLKEIGSNEMVAKGPHIDCVLVSV